MSSFRRERKRQEVFFKPLSAFIARATYSIQRVANDPGDVVDFKNDAVQWFSEARDFLILKCSEQEHRNFFGPIEDPKSMEFPTDFLRTREEIIKFYEMRVKLLENIRRDSTALCNKQCYLLMGFRLSCTTLFCFLGLTDMSVLIASSKLSGCSETGLASGMGPP